MSFDLQYHQFVSPDFNNAFKQIYTCRDLGLQTAYSVRELAKALDMGTKKFDEKRQDIYKVVEKMEQKDAEEFFRKEMTAFGNKKITVKAKKISLRSLENIKLSGFDLDLLEPVINDDVLRVVD